MIWRFASRLFGAHDLCGQREVRLSDIRLGCDRKWTFPFISLAEDGEGNGANDLVWVVGPRQTVLCLSGGVIRMWTTSDGLVLLLSCLVLN